MTFYRGNKIVFVLRSDRNLYTVKRVDIRQKKEQHWGVESPKLSGFIPVSSLKVSQLNNNTSFSTLAETLIKQVFPV